MPIAAEAGVSLMHMALAWVLEHPSVTAAIVGPRTQSQLDDLLAVATSALMPTRSMRSTRSLSPGRP